NGNGDNGNGDGPVSHDVDLAGFDFVPDELSVIQGDEIVYEYVSGPPHNVVTVDADGTEIDHSGPPFSEGTYEFTASDAGQFYVYCEPHASTGDADPANWTGMVMDLEVASADDGDAPGDDVSSEIGEVSFQIDQAPPETSVSL